MKTNFTLVALILYAFCYSQPIQVKDIDTYCCLGGSSPSSLFVHNGLIYFSAHDYNGTNSPGNLNLGRELWVSDGTTSGTVLLKDIYSGSADSNLNNFFVYNTNLYFTANSGSGNALFTSDGTEGGTSATGNGPVLNRVELGGLIYHINTSGNKLNEFNGTSNSVAGSGDEYIINGLISALNGRIICYMNMSSEIGTVGTELYSYDPNLDAFQLIKDIGGGQLDSDLLNFTVLGTHLYFSAFSESELWKTDGTDIGTVNISAAASISSFANFYSWNGKLFFEGDDGSGDQLWVYDPITDEVTNLSQLTGSFPNHDPSDYAELNGWLYYRGEDSNDNNGHLWRTDGIATYQLDNTIINVDDLVVLNNKLYFEGNNGVNGNELFEYDPATLSIMSLLKEELMVYPNPTTQFLNIKSHSSISKIEVYNVLGETILTSRHQNEIDISNFRSGVYLFKFFSENGEVTKSVIKL